MKTKIHDYEIYEKRFLGRGSFSLVYLGRYLGETNIYISKGMRVAIKIIDKNKLSTSFMKIINDEINIMLMIRDNPHPNIVKCYDVIDEKDSIYMILEYCDCGDLRRLIEMKKKPLKEKFVQYYFSQLASGLKFLMDRNIIHRDIKPRNILLTNDRRELRIADFGFARRIKNISLFDTICGSPLYMAPEIMGKENYNKQTDLWSIGIILFEMLYNFHPYNRNKTCREPTELMNKIKDNDLKIPPKNTKNKYVSAQCLDLLKKLLQRDVQKRMTWKEFFNHEWINIFNDVINKRSVDEKNIIQNYVIIEDYYSSNNIDNNDLDNKEIDNDNLDDEGIFHIELESDIVIKKVLENSCVLNKIDNGSHHYNIIERKN